jgi:hypothetical protein
MGGYTITIITIIGDIIGAHKLGAGNLQWQNNICASERDLCQCILICASACTGGTGSA